MVYIASSLSGNISTASNLTVDTPMPQRSREASLSCGSLPPLHQKALKCVNILPAFLLSPFPPPPTQLLPLSMDTCNQGHLCQSYLPAIGLFPSSSFLTHVLMPKPFKPWHSTCLHNLPPLAVRSTPPPPSTNLSPLP